MSRRDSAEITIREEDNVRSTRDRNIPKPELYREIAQQLEALLEGERDLVANAANTAALVFQTLPDLNWTGFYFLRDGNQLVPDLSGQTRLRPHPRGPGRVRHGSRARRESIVVADVEVFPGHIACDTASRSELVRALDRRRSADRRSRSR